MTTRWGDFEEEAPALAAAVRERFGMYRHHVLATLRADGAPRVTGLEAGFGHGELWLGMMPNSRKALDLLRDPRFALHANPGEDAEMEHGDARVSGRAVEVTDPAKLAEYAGEQPEGEVPEVFHLFRVDLTEVVRTYLDVPDMCMDVWRPGVPVRTIRRGNDDAPPREEEAKG
ncbi:pyridoxamine 5'-phosphate oxidase family protein [Streptomyces sp. RKND-216]|uniref:pyridoxamine 5'-phosphate oxidase family protein n=1 Tax=Streptomyces sp. RKND-216 TaxID=2562581 RepID=UPI00109DCA49|nr:pyridoxamine 5'-phosphate oxidase family protein [Streptomyces sp. RKND-216]THA23759.1 pyridoxamine 5'-phosphate oxidase family protein [Streptomyces sp. RKND-216]